MKGADTGKRRKEAADGGAQIARAFDSFCWRSVAVLQRGTGAESDGVAAEVDQRSARKRVGNDEK